ncbi:hypothetical protein AMTR_s00018p00116900 [Amborella trichopoda]|uniref:Uncharacterized protein n=1 Tax=Amborella trichopoda TaxID=13333 RepID=W1PKG0_AMBTC|nr:hypothetical protein AMTR_s00018p00116900 [Amborella trichopoda]
MVARQMELTNLFGGGIRIEPERPNTTISNDLPLKSLMNIKKKTASNSDRNTSSKKATIHLRVMSLAMTEMAQSIKMLACDTASNDSTLVLDGLSKAIRDTCKIVAGMWKVGEVGDDALLTAARIF